MKKTLFVDLKYHYKTKSSLFFIDILESNGFIVIIRYIDDFIDHKNLIAYANENDFSIIFLWQVILNPSELVLFHNKNIILIPMYDACFSWNSFKWYQYRNYRFISFSKALSKIFANAGIDYFYIQYFQENIVAVDKKKCDKTSLQAFVWRRSSTLNLDRLFYSLLRIGVKNVILHDSPDSTSSKLDIVPQFAGLNIAQTTWFYTHKEYLEIVGKCDIYIAPRRLEGIGMSFIEAMSLGLCVIAPNSSTMNEYIINGYNGFLFDKFSDIEKIDLNNIDKIKKNIIDDYKTKQYSWKYSQNELIAYLENTINRENRKKINFVLMCYDSILLFLIRIKRYVLNHYGKPDY